MVKMIAGANGRAATSPTTPVSLSVVRHWLSSRPRSHQRLGQPTLIVNMRVVGVGGADLVLKLRAGALVAIERGASDQAIASVELTSDDFWWYQERRAAFPWPRFGKCLTMHGSERDTDEHAVVLQQIGYALFGSINQ